MRSVLPAFLAVFLAGALAVESSAQVTIAPGSTGSSLGVTIDNNTNSTGNGVISDAGGGAASVHLEAGFNGDVTGFGSDDTMITGANVTADITATGGTIQIGGSNTTLTVTNPEGSGHSVTVLTVGGDEITVSPGNSIDIHS